MTRVSIALLIFVAAAIISAGAQTEATNNLPAGLDEVVKKQFGPCFEISTRSSEVKIKYLHPGAEEAPFVPFVIGDVDGDGIEDAVIVAHCKNPLADEADFGYKVIDPYYAAHGFGDPKITSQFGSTDPTAGENLLLVIHGSGAEGWRSATPKAKFVMINLPFRTVTMGRIRQKKVTVPSIKLIEADSLSSVLFWDGKKYKWADVAGNN